DHTLILAPTGSGKTLAAFLWGIDRLMTEPAPDKVRRTRLLYISPLRALAVDVEKNLRAPLAGSRLAAERLGLEVHEPSVGMRTGDTAADERRRLVRDPPDLLITTPESLYLMLTSQARETLRDVEVIVPVDDMGALGEIIEEPISGPAAAGPVRRSIWPAMHPRLLELVESHRSTLVFVNSRRLAERLATRLNELKFEGENAAAEASGKPPSDAPAEELVRAHHGSLSRERRLQIEDALKSGRLKGLVCTSSLELGIDM